MSPRELGSLEGEKLMKTTIKSFTIVALVMLTLPTIAVSASDSSGKAHAGNVEANLAGEMTLQEWFNANGYTVNVTEDELGLEVFEEGYYQISILAEIAGYAPLNNLSWYATSSGEMYQIFSGANSTGDTTFFNAAETFGLALGSPDGTFYTETYRNPDGFDHALVFTNPNPPGGYIIAWEDLWNGGDKDFQDMILATLIPVIEAKICICPHTLNLKSEGRWMTCFIKLPNGYDAEEINVSTILLNDTIPAEPKPTAIINLRRFDTKLLMVKFNRTAVKEYINSSTKVGGNHLKRARVTLTVSGKLFSGQAFEGSTKIRVMHPPKCEFNHNRKSHANVCSDKWPLACGSPWNMPL
jgi:hypothetical protein